MEDFDNLNVNPLQQYFRMPGTIVNIPSGGRFQNEGNVTFTASGEVEVFPMKASDEMLMKNPESLMSGAAIERAIKSCVPGVRDVQQLPSPDVDTLLLAIRAATYGSKMEINEVCPNCGKDHSMVVNINLMLETVRPLEDQYQVRINDDMVVNLRPFTFRTSTRANIMAFQEARKVQLVDNDNYTEQEKNAQLQESFERITAMNMSMISESIESIAIPNGVVVDRRHIKEFVDQAPAPWIDRIQEELGRINREYGLEKEVETECQSCNHKWLITVGFDPSTFFGQGS